MKIERISENQIRCTLSKRDLAERHLEISELAYGSEKAREFFREMMERANMDFGFEADDIPLMIEAIPTSKESIVLVITKVENQDEFEEKFSRFGNIADRFDESSSYDDDYYYEEQDDMEDDLEDGEAEEDFLVNCFDQLNQMLNQDGKDSNSEFVPLSDILKKQKQKSKSADKSQKKTKSNQVAYRLFSFTTLNQVIDASKAVEPLYHGKNSVWKSETQHRYFLVMKSNNSDTFHHACSIVSEFGKKETFTYATLDFFSEHYKLILKDNAISQLSQLA